MIKEIVKDREFLSKPAEEATAADTQVIEDLRDTLASLEDAVCLAANQIGSTKAVIAYRDGDRIAVMLNPKIKRGAQPYKTQESCLSLEDLSEVRRFQMVTVAYQVLAGENLVAVLNVGESAVRPEQLPKLGDPSQFLLF